MMNTGAGFTVNVGTLLRAFAARGFSYNKRDFELNVVGLRLQTAANLFDDVLAIFFWANNREFLFLFPCTTDPGFYYRKNPVAANGCAVLVPGQYAGAWQIGLHRNQYPALVQCAPVTVWRDNNRNTQLDENCPIETGVFGINIHRANAVHESQQVDNFSAGCQVLANPQDFAVLMALAEKHRALYGNRFTYTLLPENWLACV